MKYSVLEAKEALENIYNQQLISKREYQSILQLLDSNQITPDEVCTGYIPFVEGKNRHR